MIMKDTYQGLYDNTDYGKHADGRCPGVRYIPHYIDHIKAPVLDLGCGSGDTCIELRKVLGTEEVYGMDQVEYSKDPRITSGDITSPIDMSRYNSATCIDVFEHIPDVELEILVNNLLGVPKQVIAISNGSDIVDGVQLHVNIKPFEIWERWLEDKGFVILKKIEAQPGRNVYLTERK